MRNPFIKLKYIMLQGWCGMQQEELGKVLHEGFYLKSPDFEHPAKIDLYHLNHLERADLHENGIRLHFSESGEPLLPRKDHFHFDEIEMVVFDIDHEMAKRIMEHELGSIEKYFKRLGYQEPIIKWHEVDLESKEELEKHAKAVGGHVYIMARDGGIMALPTINLKDVNGLRQALEKFVAIK